MGTKDVCIYYSSIYFHHSVCVIHYSNFLYCYLIFIYVYTHGRTHIYTWQFWRLIAHIHASLQQQKQRKLKKCSLRCLNIISVEFKLVKHDLQIECVYACYFIWSVHFVFKWLNFDFMVFYFPFILCFCVQKKRNWWGKKNNKKKWRENTSILCSNDILVNVKGATHIMYMCKR